MVALLRLARRFDRLSTSFGRALAWLSLAMVLIAAFNALARYSGKALGINLASNGLLEAQWYLFALLFLLGAAPTLAADRHVRVDVFYGRLSERRKALVDLLGCLFLLLPFCLFALVVSLPTVQASWAVWEVSPDPGGLPRWPIKTVVPLAFAWLTLQGVSFALQRGSIALGRGDKP
jgi:TRAP-type mannitol/chloroaromatic compound transport system permease small subunit